MRIGPIEPISQLLCSTEVINDNPRRYEKTTHKTFVRLAKSLLARHTLVVFPSEFTGSVYNKVYMASF